MKPEGLLPCDVIMTSRGSPIAKFMDLLQKDKCVWGHIAMIKDANTGIEANWKLRPFDLDKWFHGKRIYKIIRPTFLSEAERESCIVAMEDLIGEGYSISRICLQLLDHLFHTNWWTRRFKNRKEQVCSSYIAWGIYQATGLKVNGLSWSSVEPDDFEDAQLKYPDCWVTVAESLTSSKRTSILDFK